MVSVSFFDYWSVSWSVSIYVWFGYDYAYIDYDHRNDGNPLIDGRKGRRRMRSRSDVVERERSSGRSHVDRERNASSYSFMVLKHDGIAIIAITITVLMALASSSGSRQDDRFQISSLSSSYRYANLSVLQEQIKDIIIIRTRHSAGICTYVRVKSSELYLDA